MNLPWVQAATALADGSLLQALQRQNRLRAACMRLAIAERDETVELEDDAAADMTPVLTVRLASAGVTWRAFITAMSAVSMRSGNALHVPVAPLRSRLGSYA